MVFIYSFIYLFIYSYCILFTELCSIVVQFLNGAFCDRDYLIFIHYSGPYSIYVYLILYNYIYTPCQTEGFHIRLSRSYSILEMFPNKVQSKSVSYTSYTQSFV